MTLRAGDLKWPVRFFRDGPEIDDGYTKRPGPPVELANVRCKVEWGNGQERRSAAQESADQPATFKTWWTPTLATLTPKDHLEAFGAVWDITSTVPIGQNKELHITATRAA